MMKIGIDATCWSNLRGYGRYTRGLLTALLAQAGEEYEFIFFLDRHTVREWRFPAGVQLVVVETGEAPSAAASADGRRSLRDLWAMSAAVSRTPLDVFYFPSVYTYFPVRTEAQVLLGIHDVIAEQHPDLVFPDRRARTLWNTKGWLGRRQADYIVTVSDYAAAGIQQQFQWPAERLWVVGEAPADIFRPLDRSTILPTLRRFGLDADTRYIACLGGLNPHKNLGMLLHVLASLRRQEGFGDVQLLLIGPAEEDTFTPGTAGVRQQIAELGLQEAVHLTGYVEDETVAHLLNGAQLLAMPSLAEGYGLGAVEAAACGVPVIATENSPLPHLLAGGGCFLDPTRPEAWRAALQIMLSDEAQRQQMAHIACQRAQALTWERAAGQFLDLLAHIEQRKELVRG